jgi:hypothetical protein
MKYSSNFEGTVVQYEPWAEMPVALLLLKHKGYRHERHIFVVRK